MLILGVIVACFILQRSVTVILTMDTKVETKGRKSRKRTFVKTEQDADLTTNCDQDCSRPKRSGRKKQIDYCEDDVTEVKSSKTLTKSKEKKSVKKTTKNQPKIKEEKVVHDVSTTKEMKKGKKAKQIPEDDAFQDAKVKSKAKTGTNKRKIEPQEEDCVVDDSEVKTAAKGKGKTKKMKQTTSDDAKVLKQTKTGRAKKREEDKKTLDSAVVLDTEDLDRCQDKTVEGVDIENTSSQKKINGTDSVCSPATITNDHNMPSPCTSNDHIKQEDHDHQEEPSGIKIDAYVPLNSTYVLEDDELTGEIEKESDTVDTVLNVTATMTKAIIATSAPENCSSNGDKQKIPNDNINTGVQEALNSQENITLETDRMNENRQSLQTFDTVNLLTNNNENNLSSARVTFSSHNGNQESNTDIDSNVNQAVASRQNMRNHLRDNLLQTTEYLQVIDEQVTSLLQKLNEHKRMELQELKEVNETSEVPVEAVNENEVQEGTYEEMDILWEENQNQKKTIRALHEELFAVRNDFEKKTDKYKAAFLCLFGSNGQRVLTSDLQIDSLGTLSIDEISELVLNKGSV